MLCRSLFFLNRKAAVARKLLGCTHDVIVLDMEDSVLMEDKDAARKDLSSFIHDWSGTIPLYVRLNGFENEPELYKDLEKLSHTSLSGFLLPKVNDASDVKELNNLLLREEKLKSLPPGLFKLIPVIETPIGYFNALEIAKSCKRNVALIPGVYDLAAECNAGENSTTIRHIQGQVLLAAKAAGITALTSGGICEIDDPSDFERRCLEAKHLGFDGSAVLTPTQSVIANKVFSQSKGAVKMAKDILIKKERESICVFQKSIHETKIMVGPPTVKTAVNVLKRNQDEIMYDKMLSKENKEATNQNQGIPMEWMACDNTFNKGVGDVIRTPFEITLYPSMVTIWNSSFYNSSPMSTSQVFARKHGLQDAHMPFSMLPFMTLAMSVTSFSAAARFHLGLFNAQHLEPVCAGNTIRNTVRLDDVTAAGTNGEYDIVTSTHSLMDTENRPLFTVQKRTMFAKGKFERGDRTSNKDSEVKDSSTNDYPSWLQFRPCTPAPPAVSPIQAGKLYIHRLVKVFGRSETRALCHLFWVTNPHHFNICKFAAKDILVPGPLVTAAATANVGLDLGHVIFENTMETINLNKVNMGDMISSVSFVTDITRIPGRQGWLSITSRTLGITNLDPEELEGLKVPCELLHGSLADMRARDIEKILRETCPTLHRKISCLVTRKLISIANH